MKIGININYRNIEGVLTEKRHIINFIQKPVHELSKKNTMDTIYSVIDQLIDNNISAIGLSLPSKIDKDKGIVYDLARIPHWKGLRIQRILQTRYGIPVFFNNDVNCMAMGEKHFGLGINFSDFLCLNFDETIGASYVINNRLSVNNNQTFENIDCLSQSYYYTIRNYRKSYMRTIEELIYFQKKFTEEMRNPDHEIWTHVGITVGRLISIILNNFNPQVIILGGYLSKSFHQLQNVIDQYMKSYNKANINISHILLPSSNQNIKALGATTFIPVTRKI